jgi:hypothetical protein
MSCNLITSLKSGECLLKYSRLRVKIMQTVNLIQYKISIVGNAVLIKRELYPYIHIKLIIIFSPLSSVYLL